MLAGFAAAIAGDWMLAVRGSPTGSPGFLAGVGFMVVGSILQTVKTILFHIGPLEFNYNAVYHVFTILYILFLFVGVLRGDRHCKT